MKNKILQIMYKLSKGEINYNLASKQVLDLSNVSGSVFPCFTEGGEIFAIAESHYQAVRIAKDRYGEDVPDEMLAAIIDEWQLGKHCH